jgi:hypothetical protein
MPITNQRIPKPLNDFTNGLKTAGRNVAMAIPSLPELRQGVKDFPKSFGEFTKAIPEGMGLAMRAADPVSALGGELLGQESPDPTRTLQRNGPDEGLASRTAKAIYEGKSLYGGLRQKGVHPALAFGAEMLTPSMWNLTAIGQAAKNFSGGVKINKASPTAVLKAVGDFAKESGTSLSTPQMAGIAAGFQPEFDENGNFKGMGYNEKRAGAALLILNLGLPVAGMIAGKAAKGFKDGNQFNRIADGAEGATKFEIPDVDAKINLNDESMKGLIRSGGEVTYKLGDVLDHKGLFEGYPELKDVDVTIARNNDAFTNKTALAESNTDTNGITIRPVGNVDQFRRNLLHEIEHFVQNIEGFQTGTLPEKMDIDPQLAIQRNVLMQARVATELKEKLGSWEAASTQMANDINPEIAKSAVSAAKQYDGLEDIKLAQQNIKSAIELDTWEKYNNMPGESEAGAVETRASMTPEQLASTDPYAAPKLANSGEMGNIPKPMSNIRPEDADWIKRSVDDVELMPNQFRNNLEDAGVDPAITDRLVNIKNDVARYKNDPETLQTIKQDLESVIGYRGRGAVPPSTLDVRAEAKAGLERYNGTNAGDGYDYPGVAGKVPQPADDSAWVKDQLVNDDMSSDEEMYKLFVDNGINPAQAKEVIKLRQSVMTDPYAGMNGSPQMNAVEKIMGVTPSESAVPGVSQADLVAAMKKTAGKVPAPTGDVGSNSLPYKRAFSSQQEYIDNVNYLRKLKVPESEIARIVPTVQDPSTYNETVTGGKYVPQKLNAISSREGILNGTIKDLESQIQAEISSGAQPYQYRQIQDELTKANNDLYDLQQYKSGVSGKVPSPELQTKLDQNKAIQQEIQDHLDDPMVNPNDPDTLEYKRELNKLALEETKLWEAIHGDDLKVAGKVPQPDDYTEWTFTGKDGTKTTVNGLRLKEMGMDIADYITQEGGQPFDVKVNENPVYGGDTNYDTTKPDSLFDSMTGRGAWSKTSGKIPQPNPDQLSIFNKNVPSYHTAKVTNSTDGSVTQMNLRDVNQNAGPFRTASNLGSDVAGKVPAPFNYQHELTNKSMMKSRGIMSLFEPYMDKQVGRFETATEQDDFVGKMFNEIETKIASGKELTLADIKSNLRNNFPMFEGNPEGLNRAARDIHSNMKSFGVAGKVPSPKEMADMESFLRQSGSTESDIKSVMEQYAKADAIAPNARGNAFTEANRTDINTAGKIPQPTSVEQDIKEIARASEDSFVKYKMQDLVRNMGGMSKDQIAAELTKLSTSDTLDSFDRENLSSLSNKLNGGTYSSANGRYDIAGKIPKPADDAIDMMPWLKKQSKEVQDLVFGEIAGQENMSGDFSKDFTQDGQNAWNIEMRKEAQKFMFEPKKVDRIHALINSQFGRMNFEDYYDPMVKDLQKLAQSKTPVGEEQVQGVLKKYIGEQNNQAGTIFSEGMEMIRTGKLPTVSKVSGKIPQPMSAADMKAFGGRDYGYDPNETKIPQQPVPVPKQTLDIPLDEVQAEIDDAPGDYTKNAAPMLKKVWDAGLSPDQLKVARDGTVTFRQSYYYKMGKSPELLAKQIQSALPDAQIVSTNDEFAQWPKSSYFAVKFKVPKATSGKIPLIPKR